MISRDVALFKFVTFLQSDVGDIEGDSIEDICKQSSLMKKWVFKVKNLDVGLLVVLRMLHSTWSYLTRGSKKTKKFFLSSFMWLIQKSMFNLTIIISRVKYYKIRDEIF